MKHAWLMLVCASSLATAAWAQAPADRPKQPPQPGLTIRTDKPDALYACGAPATFCIAVTNAATGGGPVEARVTFLRDFREELSRTNIAIRDGESRIAGTLDKPGFLTCRVEYNTADGKTQTALAAAGFAPEQIRPGQDEPADFDAFWASSRQALATIPLDPVVTPCPTQNPNVEAFKIGLANLDGTRAWGFLTMAKNQKGPFALLVSVPGANFRAPSAPGWDRVGDGVMRLWISVHPHDPQLPKDQLDALEKSPAGNYTRLGAPDRERYYFRRAILGADRLIDYVCANYPWDGKHCVVSGGSQGGAFALFMAGFNRRVTACAAEKPALCDHAAYLQGRGTGWPNLASYQTAELQSATLAMSGYFDAVFFARRVKVPTVFSVGFIDGTCPPGSVYAAFNQVPGPKRIFAEPLRGHAFGNSEYSTVVEGSWLREQLGLPPAEPSAKP